MWRSLTCPSTSRTLFSGLRVSTHGKQVAPYSVRFLLTSQEGGVGPILPRVPHGVVKKLTCFKMIKYFQQIRLYTNFYLFITKFLSTYIHIQNTHTYATEIGLRLLRVVTGISNGITITCLCIILQYNTAVKAIIFRLQNLIFFLFLLKT